MKVKVVDKFRQEMHKRHFGATAGIDIRENFYNHISLEQLKMALIPSGLFETPVGFEARIQVRSGLTSKYNVYMLNTEGMKNADYRGENKIKMINLPSEKFEVINDERATQIFVSQHTKAKQVAVEELNQATLATGGFRKQDRNNVFTHIISRPT